MERISGIYKITCVPTGKVYIGQSCDIYNRWYMHKWELNKQKHGNSYLQHAWNKYGENNFNFEIIEPCDEAIIDDKEKYYIDFYKSTDKNKGFNLDSGGNLNKKHSPETIEKIRQAQLGEKSPLYQKPLSKEHREKISKTMKGVKKSAETRRNMLIAQTKCSAKKVERYTLDGQYINTYNSVSEAARAVNGDFSKIAGVCRGVRKSTAGYKWKYLDEEATVYR